jgi:hypothetical protein
MREIRNACRIIIRKPKVGRSLGRPRHVWACNIKINDKKIKL